MVSETYWWEQLVLFKTELKHSNHAIIIIQHHESAYLDICTQLAHSLCNHQDLLSRLSSDRIALLLSDKDDIATEVFKVVTQMIEIYPWKRKGLTSYLPKVLLQDILTFPFTLDQLEQNQAQEGSNGSTAQ
jgi:hypothetical protein